MKAAFREHSGITNSAEVDRQLADGYKNLEVIKRQVQLNSLHAIQIIYLHHIKFTVILFDFFLQVIIGHMFGTDRLVIEKKPQ